MSDIDRREQVPTIEVSVARFMVSAAFAQGVADVRAARPPRFDKSDWDQWHYERGRLWAVIAPRSVSLKVNGRLNPAALTLYKRARGLIP